MAAHNVLRKLVEIEDEKITIIYAGIKYTFYTKAEKLQWMAGYLAALSDMNICVGKFENENSNH